MRECEERICITLPGRIDLYAEDSNKAYGFTRWDGACQGTNRGVLGVDSQDRHGDVLGDGELRRQRAAQRRADRSRAVASCAAR